MPGASYLTDGTHQLSSRQDRQKSKPDHRIRHKSRTGEIGIISGNDFIKPRNGLVKLRANATGQEVAIRWKLPEQKHWSILCDTISLWQWRQDDAGFSHMPKSGFVSLIMDGE